MCLDIMDEKWDIAIVLDACRYDTFKQLHKKYIPGGSLGKRRGASRTLEWLQKNFSNYSDIIYVSGHPGINSAGVPWKGWSAKGKFKKIYDAWMDGWDETAGTTDPLYVTKELLSAIRENHENRIIAHYAQPHAPYRKSPVPKDSDFGNVLIGGHNPKKSEARKFSKRVQKRFGCLINLLHLKTLYFGVRKMMNIKPGMGEYYWRNFTSRQLMGLYIDNLEWALETLPKLFDELKGTDKRVVITADHGEAFGEHGYVFHDQCMYSPIVRDVPFFMCDF